MLCSTRCPCHPYDSFSPVTPPANVGLKRVGTNYTVLSPIHDEGIDLASEYTSNADPHWQPGFQSNSSHDLITNGAITEEMTHTRTYIQGQGPNEAHLQTDFTTDYAPPPAYDSLTTRSQNLETLHSGLIPGG
jgi:hypothetical protein